MKKVYKYLFVFMAFGALFFSCTKLETNFASLTKDYDPNIKANLVFLNGNMIYEVENNIVSDKTVTIKLQVWGPLRSSATTVGIAVRTAKSTAQPGVHYTLSTTSVTIPANKGGASFDLVMHANNFAKGDTVLLEMGLTTTDFATDTYPSTAMLYLSKKPECPYEQKNFTGSYVADETGYGKYNVDFRPDANNPKRIWQTNFWDWTDDLLAFDLDPVTGIVTVPSQSIVMGDGNPYEVVGSGTFDLCTHVMVVDFGGDVDGTHEVYTPGTTGKSLIVNKKGK